MFQKSLFPLMPSWESIKYGNVLSECKNLVKRYQKPI